MIAFKLIVAIATAITGVLASTLSESDELIAALLKRQAPGTPEYNCHDNCGQAIIEARNSANPCKDDTFLTDYNNCLQCAGPDNTNIWMYYGNTLSVTASKCGLSATPLAGVQPPVGTAIPAASSTGSGSTSSSSKSESTSAPSEPESTSGGLAATTAPSQSTPTYFPPSSTPYSAPIGSNATSTGASTSVSPTTTPVQVNSAGQIGLEFAAFFGAVALGATFML